MKQCCTHKIIHWTDIYINNTSHIVWTQVTKSININTFKTFVESTNWGLSLSKPDTTFTHYHRLVRTLTLTVLTQEEVSLTCNRRIPVNNKLGLSVIVSCPSKLKSLSSVAFQAVGDLHKFDFILVINRTHNKLQQMESDRHNAIHLCYHAYKGPYPTLSRSKLFSWVNKSTYVLPLLSQT